MFRTFGAAWRFLTVFPYPVPAGDDEAELLSRTPAYFAAVGAVLGVAAGCAVAVAGLALPDAVTAVVAVALLAGCSAGLHLDGLADSADGLLSPGRTRERALEVMRDSRIGAHGALALVLVLLLKAACLASLPRFEMALTAFLMPLAGRAAMLFPMLLLPYARESGLGRAFAAPNPRLALSFSCVWVGVGMLLCFGLVGGAIGFGVWLGTAFGWVLFLRRRLGGATGDAYGAACELAEAATAFSAAIVFGEKFF